MAFTAKIDVKDKDILGSLEDFTKDILELEDIKAILVPQHLPMKNMVMPTLVTDPEHLNGIDPLAPVFPMNAAKMVSRLTRKPLGGKIVALMRPCEIRAFIELVKLKQGSTDDIVLIGIDCLGAYQNKDYFRFIEQNGDDSTDKFYRQIMDGDDGQMDGIDLAPACKACEYPVSEKADILIGLYGMDIDQSLLVQSQTDAGDQILKHMNFSAADEPRARPDAINAVITRRTGYRDDMFARTREATENLEKLSTYFATCVNCYNCRVACPVRAGFRLAHEGSVASWWEASAARKAVTSPGSASRYSAAVSVPSAPTTIPNPPWSVNHSNAASSVVSSPMCTAPVRFGRVSRSHPRAVPLSQSRSGTISIVSLRPGRTASPGVRSA